MAAAVLIAEAVAGVASLTVVVSSEAAVVAPTKFSTKPPWAEAQAFTLLGRSLYQAGRVPASISLMSAEREVASRISSYQESGMAVSSTVRIELGTDVVVVVEAGMVRLSARASSLAISSSSELTGLAKAGVRKRRATNVLKCILMGIVLVAAKD